MEKKKSIGFGGRGWLLVFYQMFAYAAFSAFTSYPQNTLGADFISTQVLTWVYTGASIVAVILQFFVFAPRMGRIKSIKWMGLIFGFITIASALGVMLIPGDPTGKNIGTIVFWYVAYVILTISSVLWSSFFVTVLIGNWFPRRRGTVMGIATFAFPIVNGLLLTVFMFASGTYGRFWAFSPFLLIAIIGILFCLLFITDYPEQCGCFRDNDKNMTAEVANAMLMAELEAKKNTVWTRKKVFGLRDTWFLVLSEAFILLSSVGMMVQIVSVLGEYEGELSALAFSTMDSGMFLFLCFGQGSFTILTGISIFALLGSWLLGMIDTKFGTKTAIIITACIMFIAGVLGAVHNVYCILIACLCLALFMGAASNYGLSGFARYWRREDFASVFAACAPVGCILQAFGPTFISTLATVEGLKLGGLTLSGYSVSFAFVAFLAVVSFILILLFNPKHVIEVDNKLRAERGLVVDDELVKRLEAEKVKK